MEWRVLLVLLFAVSFTCALPAGELDADPLLEDQTTTDLEDPLEEDSAITDLEDPLEEDSEISDLEDTEQDLEDIPGVFEDEDYKGCKDKASRYWCSGRKNKCSSKQVYLKCRRTCRKCAVNGKWSKWSPYTECSKKCGKGKQSRKRFCNNPAPAYGGKTCKGPAKQTRYCNTKPCPVDGAWSPWSPYTKCSKKCGGGSRSRSRTCTNPKPAYGGKPCVGPAKETDSCNTQPCPVDGKWSPWSPYGDCSKSCDGGSQSRSRKCDNPAPAFGGQDCQGSPKQSRRCNTQACPVDGEWSPWSPYGKCSASCGGGSKSRSRKCNNPAPANGGQDCQGPPTESRDCNTQACPVDGKWSPWSPYGECSKSCGGGSQSRSRKCDNPPPAFGGNDCQGSAEQSRVCNKQQCPVDGEWSTWSPYGKCSVSCGGGSKSRSRKCNNPAPANGGQDCQGPPKQSRDCNTQACPVDGDWSPWSPWSTCSRSCGPGGRQTRKRSCTNPPPSNGGKKCRGVSSQERKCVKIVPCPKPPCKDKKGPYYCQNIKKQYKCGKSNYYKYCRKTCNKCPRY